MQSLLEPSNYKIFTTVKFCVGRLLRTSGAFTESSLLRQMPGADETKREVLLQLIRGHIIKKLNSSNTDETVYISGE